ncbi:MAG: TonB family protein [Gammaproteobacteria bacterium]|nr:TonB family protein [Gammaproteobacteria bacterium]
MQDQLAVNTGSYTLNASQSLPEFTENDRMGVTFFGSFLLHMIIVLGITFGLPKLRELDGLPTLEITLVQTRSEQAPDQADYLAQANQDGGGNHPEKGIARNPLPIQEIGESTNILPSHQPMFEPQKSRKQDVAELMTADKSADKARKKDSEQRTERRPPADSNPGMIDETQPADERARLNAEISRFWQEYQQLPRKKFINARTREYKYAAYMDAWRAKVERVGNLNYPEAARQRDLAGDLVLDVALKPDGSLHALDVRRSSGHKLLDDAAIRIVTLAAPFAPFPKSIKDETDILHITRTWKFNQGGWLQD